MFYTQNLCGPVHTGLILRILQPSFLNDNITFTTPAGTFSVTPDPATAQQGSVGRQFYYVRSANMTNLVNAGGAGPYTTGGVQATRTSADTAISRSVGWTLEVSQIV